MWHLVSRWAEAITSLVPALIDAWHGPVTPEPTEHVTPNPYESGHPVTTLEDALSRANQRQLRLLGCALCRSGWPFLCDIRSREAVEAAELLADGHCTRTEAHKVSLRAGGASLTDRARAAMLVASPSRRAARRAALLLAR